MAALVSEVIIYTRRSGEISRGLLVVGYNRVVKPTEKKSENWFANCSAGIWFDAKDAANGVAAILDEMAKRKDVSYDAGREIVAYASNGTAECLYPRLSAAFAKLLTENSEAAFNEVVTCCKEAIASGGVIE